MAKIPFRGIAQIATAQPAPPATASPVVAPRSEPAQAPSTIRPLGYSAEDAQTTPPRAGLARWWSMLKRMFLEPPR